MMRRKSAFFVTALAFSFAQSPAAAEPQPRVVNWTGCYVGVNVGGAFGSSDLTHNVSGDWLLVPGTEFLDKLGSPGITTSGVEAGAQIGCSWQTGSYVVGVELDAVYTGLSASTFTSGPDPNNVPVDFTSSVKSRFLTTFRGRLGYAADRWLWYVTGGLAVGEVDVSQFIAFNASGSSAFGSATSTKVGWTVGGGVEYALTAHWILRGEYLYVDLGSETANLLNSTFPTFTHRVDADFHEHIGRVGLSYKF